MTVLNRGVDSLPQWPEFSFRMESAGAIYTTQLSVAAHGTWQTQLRDRYQPPLGLIGQMKVGNKIKDHPRPSPVVGILLHSCSWVSRLASR